MQIGEAGKKETGKEKIEEKLNLELDLGLEPAFIPTHFALKVSWHPPMVSLLLLHFYMVCCGVGALKTRTRTVKLVFEKIVDRRARPGSLLFNP